MPEVILPDGFVVGAATSAFQIEGAWNVGDSTVPASLRAVGVTSREMDVLSLVAHGLTNAQIAERLFLSRRTIETHVANLLTKTGATNRGDLAHYTRAQTP